MATMQDVGAAFTLTLTEEERTQLARWLEQRLRDKLVEEHRTEASDFRDYVLHEEAILQSILKKLRR